ncbi:MAG TPA: alpha/beta hydrolase [Chloroflexota bacterium]|nr:alpha/beta hydrolase [Chloroflexota bacterium]
MAAAVSPTASLGGFEAKFIDVDGIRTRYYDVGEGEPMVLCHGHGWDGSAGANAWTLNIGGLAKRGFRVIAADKLGSGMTDNPKTDDGFTIQNQVAHMWGLVEALGLKTVHMVGQSRGGYLAGRLTLEHQDRVKTLTVVDSATLAPLVGDPHRRDKLLEGSPTDVREELVFRWTKLSYKPEHLTPEYIDTAVWLEMQPKAQETKRRWKAGGEALFNRSLAEQKEETLRRIGAGELQLPTLLYWGRKDRSAILGCGLQLFDLIAEHNPRARMYIMSDAGHFHFREYPEEFNRVVADFASSW